MSIAPFALPASLGGLQMALLTASAVLLLALLLFADRIGRVLGGLLLAGFFANVTFVLL